jgi:hypothetical protein
MRIAHAAEMKLLAPQPKPTSNSSQLESAVSLWDGGPTVAGVWECGPGEFTADAAAPPRCATIISGSGTPELVRRHDNGFQARRVLRQRRKRLVVLVQAEPVGDEPVGAHTPRTQHR